MLRLGGRENVGILDTLSFDQITGVLGRITDAIATTLEESNPKKATVELGIGFGIEAGKLVTMIARGTAEANLKVTLEWERDE